MEIIALAIIFGISIFAMVRHIVKTFNKGEKCSGCSSKKEGCCS